MCVCVCVCVFVRAPQVCACVRAPFGFPRSRCVCPLLRRALVPVRALGAPSSTGGAPPPDRPAAPWHPQMRRCRLQPGPCPAPPSATERNGWVTTRAVQRSRCTCSLAPWMRKARPTYRPSSSRPIQVTAPPLPLATLKSPEPAGLISRTASCNSSRFPESGQACAGRTSDGQTVLEARLRGRLLYGKISKCRWFCPAARSKQLTFCICQVPAWHFHVDTVEWSLRGPPHRRIRSAYLLRLAAGKSTGLSVRSLTGITGQPLQKQMAFKGPWNGLPLLPRCAHPARACTYTKQSSIMMLKVKGCRQTMKMTNALTGEFWRCTIGRARRMLPWTALQCGSLTALCWHRYTAQYLSKSVRDCGIFQEHRAAHTTAAARLWASEAYDGAAPSFFCNRCHHYT